MTVTSDSDPITDLDSYVATHLAYELKYLLVAATTWAAVHDEAQRSAWPSHLVVFSMESAFVHTRTLCEFLMLEQGWKKKSPHAKATLPLWDTYKGPMHMKVLHPDPRRPYVPGACPGDDLKERVVDLAQEVLSAWDIVSVQPAMLPIRSAMMAARGSAVADAHRSAARLGMSSPFS
jgi:hypothetical protein